MVINFRIKHFFLICISAFTGCNQPIEPDQSILGYDYFPLYSGLERVYQIERIEYKPDGEIDTSFYQLKEVIGSATESNGEINYHIARYKSTNSGADWTIDEVWSVRRNTYHAVVVEDNVPIIKISFPVEEDKRWDGNAMNSLPEDEYKMENLASSYTISEFNFSNTLEVYEEDLLDPCKIASDNYHVEVFAKGVGLIYKQDIDKNYVSSSGCQEEGVIEFGLVVEQKLIDFVTNE